MEVGPISAFDGFPVWYKDENGLRLQLNVDPSDPYSLITPSDLPNPSQPVSFPDNYPGEAFYFAAEAEMETGTGERALLVLALEAAFVNEVPSPGEQVVFGRVRIRVGGLQPNVEYTVTHPYGVDTFIAEPDGDGFGEINFTEDIGGMNGGSFELALNSRIHPFLRWDPTVEPAPPEGYIGDPNTLHPLVGSVFTDRFGEAQNIFRIEGPGIGVGSPDRATTPGLNPDNAIETRLFSVTGKISTISGVDVTRTTYTQSDASGGYIDVFATSDITPQTIEVSGQGLNPTVLQGENGLYFARVAYTGELPPSTVTVTNTSDIPPSIKEAVPVDFITGNATYDTDTQTLSILATSSDSINPVLLTVTDFGIGDLPIPDDGVLELTLSNIPANITIQSTAGGESMFPLAVTGSAINPIGVKANAGPDQTVTFGSQVTLNGTNSTGPITAYQWNQLAGSPVTLVGENTATPTFTAPDTATVLTFELVVEGEGGPSSDTVNVEVIEFAPAPIANAGPDQTVRQGSVVTLDGSVTGDVTIYQWTQLSGQEVVLTGADTLTPTFTMPKQVTTLVFELTVTGPGGTSSDEVEVSSTPDNLTVTRAEYRIDDTEWRISGTSDVPGAGVSVTIYIGDTIGGTVLAVVEVDALGAWQYRVEPSEIQPDATRAISLQSSSGGTLINVPLNVRQ
ncbi:IPT/TIG domain protein [Cytobacillus suaedae]|nr:IPT/TIG domain protein [Cytobacillus suaedae]